MSSPRPTRPKRRLIDILIKNLLTTKQAQHAAAAPAWSGPGLLDIVKLGYVTDEQVTDAIRKHKLSSASAACWWNWA